MENERPLALPTSGAELPNVRYFTRALLLLVYLPVFNTTFAVLKLGSDSN